MNLWLLGRLRGLRGLRFATGSEVDARYSVRRRIRWRFERLWKSDCLRRFQPRIAGLRLTAKPNEETGEHGSRNQKV
jgi:hypothetical protein